MILTFVFICPSFCKCKRPGSTTCYVSWIKRCWTTGTGRCMTHSIIICPSNSITNVDRNLIRIEIHVICDTYVKCAPIILITIEIIRIITRNWMILVCTWPMCCYSISCIEFCCWILITKTTFKKNYDVVFVNRISKNRVIVCCMVITFHHYGSSNIPQDIMMDCSIPSFICLSHWSIHPNSILASIMNPIVGNVGIFLLCHHHLYNCTISLQ